MFEIVLFPLEQLQNLLFLPYVGGRFLFLLKSYLAAYLQLSRLPAYLFIILCFTSFVKILASEGDSGDLMDKPLYYWVAIFSWLRAFLRSISSQLSQGVRRDQAKNLYVEFMIILDIFCATAKEWLAYFDSVIVDLMS